MKPHSIFGEMTITFVYTVVIGSAVMLTANSPDIALAFLNFVGGIL